jgi:hypothetical protein
VSVSINGFETPFEATADEDGNWSVDLSGEEFAEGVTYTATATATVTDADGDQATATDSDSDIVEDTVPESSGAQNTALVNEVGTTATASLGIDWKADGYDATSGKLEANLAGGNTNYVKAVASNGDEISVTSGGEKLVYVTSGSTVYAVKEGNVATFDASNPSTTGAVFAVSANGSSYTTTMYGQVDAYTKTISTDTSTDTTNLDVNYVEYKSDSFEFNAGNTQTTGGGNTGNPLVLSATDQVTLDNGQTVDVALKVTFTTDAGDTVNYSNQRIGVSQGNTIDDSENLYMQVSATVDGTTYPISLTNVQVTTDQLSSGEKALATVYNGSSPVGSGSIDGTGRGASDSSDERWTIDPVEAEGATSQIEFDKVAFTADTGDTYGILFGGTGGTIKIDYQVPVTVAATATTTTTVTTVASYDYSIAFTFSGTDGDGDPASTTFHVTFDANNDGVLYALDTEQSVVTTEVVTEVSTVGSLTEAQIAAMPVAEQTTYLANLATASAGDGESTDDGSFIVTGDITAVLGAGFTDSDVMVGGSGDDVLVGGSGDDTFTTGAGNDLIIINLADQTETETDTLTDFDPENDTLQIGDVLAANEADVVITTEGDTVVVTPNAGAAQEIVTTDATVAAMINESIVTQLANSNG